jgi:hypothetical protein
MSGNWSPISRSGCRSFVEVDAARLLALAALYITDELFRLRDERSEADRAASARVGALRDLLDAVVTDG